MKRAILILILCAVFLSACGNAAETAERSVSVDTSAVSQTTTAVTVSAPGSCRLAVHPVRQLEPLERRPGGPSPDHGAAPDSASRCPHGGHLCPFAAPVSSPLRPAPQVDRPSQQRGPMEPRNSGRSHKQSRLLPLSHWQKFPHPRFPLQTAHLHSILQNFFRLTKLPLRNRMQL